MLSISIKESRHSLCERCLVSKNMDTLENLIQCIQMYALKQFNVKSYH